MAGNADGSITIDTELDNRGFDKGSEKLLNAVKDLTSAVDNFGDNMMRSFQAVFPVLQNIGSTVTQIYGAINTSEQQATDAVNRMSDAMSKQSTAATEMKTKVGTAAQAATQDFRQAGQQAQDFGSDISEAVESSALDREIKAAGRSCTALSTQLQRIGDSARVGLNTDAQVVRFQIAVEKARDSITQMQSQLASLASQQFSTDEYENLAATTKKAEQALFNLYERRDIMEQMGVKENSKEWQRLAILIENAEYKLNNYERTMASMRENGTAFKTGVEAAQYQKTAADLAAMSEKLKEYEAMAAKFDTISEPANRSEQSLEDVDAELKKKPDDTQKASNGFRKFGSVLKTVAVIALRTAATLAKLSLKAVASGAKAVGNGFKTASKGIKSFITRTKSASTASKGLVKQLTSLKTMLLSKIKAAIISSIWNGAKESLQELAKFSDEFDKSMSNIKNSAKELSANLGVSLGEIIKAVEPLLTQLMDMLSRALTYLNAFFAMMQGKTTMTVAKKQTESYAESLDDAAESAEELQNQVYGFDQLNKRTESKENNDGDKNDSNDLYEEVPINSILPDEIKDMLDEIKDLIENENWTGLGEKIAEGLNAILKAIDDWINNVLRPEGVKWARAIAEILNGLVDGFDWTLLGKTIADGINALADIFNTFLTTFDFEKLGVGIGEGINSLFDNIEWDLLGQTFANQWNALINFIYGIVTTVDWSNIGDSFAEFFNNFFFTVNWNKAVDTISIGLNGITTTVQHFMDSVDWHAVGSTIGEAFNRLGKGIDWNAISTAIATGLNDISEIIDGFFSSVDWKGLGDQFADGANTLVSGINWSAINETLANGFNDLLHTITDFLEGVNWDNLGTSVADGFDSVFTTIDWSGIADSLDAVIEGLFDLVNGFLENFDWKALGDHLGDFINAIDLDQWLADIGTFISDFISSALDLCIGFIEGLDWGQLADKLWNGLLGCVQNVDWGGIVSKVVELVSAAIGAVISFVASFVATLALDIWDLLRQAWDGVYSYFSEYIDGFGGDIIAGLWEGIKNALVNVGTWIKEHILNPFIEGFKNAFGIHSPSTEMETMGTYVIEGLWQGISAAWGSITEFFSGAVEGLKTTLSGAWDKISSTAGTAWENIKTTVTSKFDAAKEKLSSTGETIKTTLSGAWDNISSTASDTWEKTKTTVSDKFSMLKDSLSETGETIKTTLTGTWDKTSSTSSVSWEKIKTDTSDKFAGLKDNLSKTGDNIKSTLSAAWDKIDSTASASWTSVKTSVSGKFTDLKNSLQTTTNNIKSELSNGWSSIQNTASQKWTSIKSTVTNLWNGLKSTLTSTDWSSVGSNLVSGLQSGISRAWSGLTSFVSNLASSLTSTVKGLFGINSPSTVWAEIGEYLDAGLGKGLKDGKKGVLKTVSNIAQSMNDGLQAEKPALDLDVGSGEVITQLSGITQRLSDIAITFRAIGDALSDIGDLRVPIIATGAEVPYKTKIIMPDATGGIDTTEFSESLSDQNELMSDTNYLLRQILSLIQKLKLNIDGDTLMEAIMSIQRGTVRSYGGT